MTPEEEREKIQIEQSSLTEQVHRAQEEEEETQRATEAGELPGPAMGRQKIQDAQSSLIEQIHRAQEAEEETQRAIEAGEIKGPAMERQKIEEAQSSLTEQIHRAQEAQEETQRAIAEGELPGPQMEGDKIQREQSSLTEQIHRAQESQEETQRAVDEGELPGPQMERDRIQREQSTLTEQVHGAQEAEDRKQQAVEAGGLPGPSMERGKIQSKQSFEIEQQHRKQEAVEETAQAVDRGELPGPSMGRENIESKESFEIQQQHAKEDAIDETKRAVDEGELPGPQMWRDEVQRQESFQIEQQHAQQEAKDAHQAEVEAGNVPGPEMERERIQKQIQFTSDQATGKEAAQAAHEAEVEAGHVPGPAMARENIQRQQEYINWKRDMSAPPGQSMPDRPVMRVNRAPDPPPRMMSAKEWNDANRIPEHSYFRVGLETSMGNGGNLPRGRMANVHPLSDKIHPWYVQPFYRDLGDVHYTPAQLDAFMEAGITPPSGTWCFHVKPGFINGHPPAMYMPLDVTQGTRVWGNDYGKNPDKRAVSHTELLQVLLTDHPTPFTVCQLGDSAAVWGDNEQAQHPGTVPYFFRVRGARKPDQLSGLDFINNVIRSASPEAAERYLLRLLNFEAPLYRVRSDVKDTLPEGDREIWRSDVVLQVDRPTVDPVMTYDDIGLLRMSGFTIRLPLRNQYSARIFSVPRWFPPKRPTYWDFFYGTYQDYPYDDLVIATIYWLSPPHKYMGSHNFPDNTWNYWVDHQVFWNLNYTSIQQIQTFKNDRSLEFFKEILGVLAGGVAYLFAVSVVNPIEATYDQIFSFYNETSVKGTFWTG